MNLGDIVFTIIVFIIPLLIIGLLIFMLISMKKRKDQLNRIEQSLSDGLSKKQIK
ncbi:hypothetical protein ACFPYN_08040 [Paenisporosarcina macmurdoensis]|uniref:DUF4083 domain-containing protein n=1 Tax=Paenisporosarcina macmurdoensis TaxID=212659 RepID=A0ABW1L7B9_9BACL